MDLGLEDVFKDFVKGPTGVGMTALLWKDLPVVFARC